MNFRPISTAPAESSVSSFLSSGVRTAAVVIVIALSALACTAGEESTAETEESTDAPQQAPAEVLGESISGSDAEEIDTTILTALTDRFAQERGLEATEEEIESHLEEMRAGMEAEGLDAEDDLTDEEREQVAEMRRGMAKALIQRWKVNRALYEEYGGRLIYQQFGPEPIDAYRQFLEEQQEAGAFVIRDPELKQRFWSYFTDESRHDFMDPDGEDAANAFADPPY